MSYKSQKQQELEPLPWFQGNLAVRIKGKIISFLIARTGTSLDIDGTRYTDYAKSETIAKLLLEYGADPNVKNNNEWTPYRALWVLNT